MRVFHQLLTPVGDSLALSFVVAALPVAVVLLMLGALQRPAWQASLAGLLTGLVIAIWLWRFPTQMALNATAAGMVFALWPVMWIVFNALLLYNIAVTSGRFDAFRDWVFQHLPGDRRVVLIVIGFCFGALLEGISGFGTPIAITSSLLILTGWPAIEALTFTLIFNTAPVAFGALGVPVTVLGKVTGLPAATLGAMVGRQLPFFALLLPFYVMFVYGGRKSVAAMWPLLLVAGGSFALFQFGTSNFGDYQLTDVFSSLGSLILTILFLRVWKPAQSPEYAVSSIASAGALGATRSFSVWQGWLPWLIVSIVVILWTHFGVATSFASNVHWPGLDKQVDITLYDKPNQPALYALVWGFQPLASGTAILCACIITALLVGIGPGALAGCVLRTCKQVWLAVVTVALIIGLAYLMNYSGMTYTLGKGAASLGPLFPFASAFLGWVAVMLSGSDTSGNALFGNLQVVAAHQLNLNPVLFAATNSSGGVMGKMISPQNIATGVTVTDLKGQEGRVFARTFKHSVLLTLLLGVLVMFEQYVIPGIVPK
jgi:lactate permease